MLLQGGVSDRADFRWQCGLRGHRTPWAGRNIPLSRGRPLGGSQDVAGHRWKHRHGLNVPDRGDRAEPWVARQEPRGIIAEASIRRDDATKSAVGSRRYGRVRASAVTCQDGSGTCERGPYMRMDFAGLSIRIEQRRGDSAKSIQFIGWHR